MNNYVIIVLALIGIIGWFAYCRAIEPQPLSDRVDSATQQLKQGELIKAMDEIAPQTRGENLLNETKELVGITPTTTY